MSPSYDYSSVISIHAGSYENTELNPIKAYVNMDAPEQKFKDSMRLGCLILNRLVGLSMQNYPFVDGISLVPIKLSLLPPDDPRQILKKEKMGVFLEIGNINAIADFNMLAEARFLKAIGAGIYNGLDDYNQAVVELIVDEEPSAETDEGMIGGSADDPEEDAVGDESPLEGTGDVPAPGEVQA